MQDSRDRIFYGLSLYAVNPWNIPDKRPQCVILQIGICPDPRSIVDIILCTHYRQPIIATRINPLNRLPNTLKMSRLGAPCEEAIGYGEGGLLLNFNLVPRHVTWFQDSVPTKADTRLSLYMSHLDTVTEDVGSSGASPAAG